MTHIGGMHSVAHLLHEMKRQLHDAGFNLEELKQSPIMFHKQLATLIMNENLVLREDFPLTTSKVEFCKNCPHAEQEVEIHSSVTENSLFLKVKDKETFLQAATNHFQQA